jgi:hypothetical protein
MRYLRLALVPLVFVACTDTQPLAPIEEGPAFNFMNGPAEPGHAVFRGSTGWLFVGVDVDGLYRSFAGIGDLDPLNNPECGGDGEFSTLEWNDVINVMYTSLNVMREATIHIYDNAEFSAQMGACLDTGEEFSVCRCQTWAEGPLVAAGTGQFVWNFATAGPGAFTYGWRTHGDLVSPLGQALRYLEVQKLVSNRNNGKWTVEKIQLTPVGP